MWASAVMPKAEGIRIAEKGVGERQRDGALWPQAGNAEEVPGEGLGRDGTPEEDEAAFYDDAGKPQAEEDGPAGHLFVRSPVMRPL